MAAYKENVRLVWRKLT